MSERMLKPEVGIKVGRPEFVKARVRRFDKGYTFHDEITNTNGRIYVLELQERRRNGCRPPYVNGAQV